MIIKQLNLTNYRKFQNVSLSFAPGTNLIIGSNASGKTTVIEALSFGIYGEPAMGANLSKIFRFGSDFCRVELTLSNSTERRAIREIKKSNDSIEQRIILDGKAIKTWNLNSILKIFMDKELFFEVTSVNQYYIHNILDMNEERFRDVFSKHIGSWDINHIMSNSRLLENQLLGRIDAYQSKLATNDTLIKNQKSVTEELQGYLTRRRELKKELEEIENDISELKEEEIQKTGELRETQHLIKTLDKVSSLQRGLLNNLRQSAKSMKVEDLSHLNPRIAESLENYISRLDNVYTLTLELVNNLNNILESQREKEHDLQGYLRERSVVLVDKFRTRGVIEHNQERISRVANEYEKKKEVLNAYMEEYEKNKLELKRLEELTTIEGKLALLARNLWKKQCEFFLSSVTNRINQYLVDLDVSVEVATKNEKMYAKLNGSLVDFNMLSGGERTLLNLLSRIALIRELGKNKLLILDDAFTFLDSKTVIKAFSFLDSLKNDFDQIIVTTHLREIPIEFDNRIVLED